MKELERKQKVRRIMYSVPSLILLSLLAFFLARGAWGVMEKERVSSGHSRELEEKAAALVLREQVLRGDIARLRTEEGVKDEIREKFSVTQAGERVAVIVDDLGATSSVNESALPWYKKFWSAIMGNL